VTSSLVRGPGAGGAIVPARGLVVAGITDRGPGYSRTASGRACRQPTRPSQSVIASRAITDSREECDLSPRRSISPRWRSPALWEKSRAEASAGVDAAARREAAPLAEYDALRDCAGSGNRSQSSRRASIPGPSSSIVEPDEYANVVRRPAGSPRSTPRRGCRQMIREGFDKHPRLVDAVADAAGKPIRRRR